MDHTVSMDRASLIEHLALVEQHVRDGERHIQRQQELLHELKRDGHDTNTAQNLLERYQQSQSLHIAKRDRLRQELSAIEVGSTA